MKRLTFFTFTALLVSGLFVSSAGAAPVRSDSECRAKNGKATCIALSASGPGASSTAKGSTITLTSGATGGSAAFAAIRNFWDMPLNDIESLRLSVRSLAGDPSGGSPRISMYVFDMAGNYVVTLFLSPYHCAGFDATSNEWQTVDFVTGDCTISGSDGAVYQGWDEVLTAMGAHLLNFAFVVQDEGPATNQIKISVA